MAESDAVRAGLAYRPALASWIESRPRPLEFLEINAEDFYKGGVGRLPVLAATYPLLVHGSRISLGTPGPLDRGELEWFAAIVEVARPLWISEHLGFRRTAEVDLAHVNPIPLTRDTLSLVADHCREVMERCRRRLLVENITSHLRIRGTLSEPEFLNRLCAETGCGVLLDLGSLLVNARNHAFEPRDWLRGLEPRHVVQLHVGAYAREGDRWSDPHASRIQEDLWDLVEEVMDFAPVQAVILERDASFPPVAELEEELRRARTIAGRRARANAPASASAPTS
jgi:uncharacterized protein (UPF0276 family)